ncbi:MAG TPA: CsbD family protein, partial [Candidatus Binatia bacterium]
ETTMDNNKFKGNWHEFKGEVKRKWGKLTDDDLLECEGDYEKFLGIVQKRYGAEKDAVQSWANDWYSEREQEEIRRRHDTISRNQV